jgi:hypothetical protein
MLRSLWELWLDDFVAYVIFVSDQCIVLEINCHNNKQFVAAIYANNAVCGGIFSDHSGAFLGCFSPNIGAFFGYGS